MKEKTLAIILTVFLLISGMIAYSIHLNYSNFNFHRSELTISENSISERLFYSPNEDYHTLYRNFASPIPIEIDIAQVRCARGTPYFNTQSFSCYVNNAQSSSNCLSFTESNEYGCSFGDQYGFFKSKEYWIEAEYNLQPENLFRIKDHYYIKFIAYSENNHKKLIKEDNFIISGEAVTARRYLPDEQVIIYIPYKKDISGFNIISQRDFEFDNKILKHLFLLFLSLIPGVALFFSWFFFGREHSEKDLPERLSMYPSKRKAWEVAAFFDPPFSGSKPNIFSALITDLYHRKVVDIKLNSHKDIYIKINKNKLDSLDNVEKDLIEFLDFLEKNSEKKEGYFKMNAFGLGIKNRSKSSSFYHSISSSINHHKKDYLSHCGFIISMISLWGLLIILTIFSPGAIAIFSFFSIMFVSIFLSRTTLLTKYKGDYYYEYKQWQSFKKFLAESPSIKLHGHQGTILWGEFLVYATAFGVAKKVLKEMKVRGIITEIQYNNYMIIAVPNSLSSHTGGFAGASGGGFSGAGGGGVGGGSGGGR